MQAAQQRSAVPWTSSKVKIEGDGVDPVEEDGGSSNDGSDAGGRQESGLEGSMRAVKGLCRALDLRVSERVACVFHPLLSISL